MEYFQVRRFEKVFDIFAETEIVTKSEIVEAVELLGSIYPQAIFNKNRIQVAFSSTNKMIWQKALNSGDGQLRFGMSSV